MAAVQTAAARTVSYTFDQMAEGFEKAGSSYEKALKGFDAAVKSGDSSKIAGAQADLQKAERIFATYQSVVQKAHEMMMKLINSIVSR